MTLIFLSNTKMLYDHTLQIIDIVHNPDKQKHDLSSVVTMEAVSYSMTDTVPDSND